MNSYLLQATLDDAFDASVIANITLRVQLRSWETTARQAIASGRLILKTTSNGHEVEFAAANAFDGLSATTALEICRRLINLYDEVKSYLGNPTDAVAKAEMMTLLEPCTSHSGDFSGLVIDTGRAVLG